MQVQIVNSSVETMEEFLSDKDEKKAIEKLRLNKKECQSMIEIAQEAAQLMEEVHVDEVSHIKDEFNQLVVNIGSLQVAEIMKRQREI